MKHSEDIQLETVLNKLITQRKMLDSNEFSGPKINYDAGVLLLTEILKHETGLKNNELWERYSGLANPKIHLHQTMDIMHNVGERYLGIEGIKHKYKIFKDQGNIDDYRAENVFNVLIAHRNMIIGGNGRKGEFDRAIYNTLSTFRDSNIFSGHKEMLNKVAQSYKKEATKYNGNKTQK